MSADRPERFPRLSSLRDGYRVQGLPVVALRLPPANCFDPFGMGDTGGPSEERNGKRMNTQVVFHPPRAGVGGRLAHGSAINAQKRERQAYANRLDLL